MGKRLFLIAFFLVTWPALAIGFLIGNAFWLMHTGFHRAREFQCWLTDFNVKTWKTRVYVGKTDAPQPEK